MRSSIPRHLVLDLDDTIIHARSDVDAYLDMGLSENPSLSDIRRETFIMKLEDVVTARGYGETEVWWVSKRPNLNLFLHYAFSTFETVSVWTAAKQKYAEAIVDNVFKDVGRPAVLWHRGMCSKDEEGSFYKPLQDLADYMGVGLDSMCILDDTFDTFSQNRENAVWMPKWSPVTSVESLRQEDDVLTKLMQMWSCDEIADHIKAETISMSIKQLRQGFRPMKYDFQEFPDEIEILV